ncbi:nucleotidyltransferase domain-containing protein [Caminibacter mediatlanticus TB-2]|uniref:Nucleotidyltransferase domain-containing protein n=1 Tax=Caminibacter mediatlanticus TB-2 TaxID=391592 RepID=A0ABX5V873_9BACT|nr:nucleotidyltransferase domain-containing protein [Caminibacter mediatlanticus]QCT94426.1 nucleotidyltransferase domain-containing protein [Caminibacter mediatlanticus TB-2]
MRLALWEVREIKDAAKKVFGNDVKVYLFGSRVDDNKKGGDIDLYVVTKNNSYENEMKFWCELQQRLGEQKIDIIVSKDLSREIEQVALKEGIEL